MKTKNIFKTVALAMLMPAMMLTTACSNEDDALNNTANTEKTINKDYALPVTVNVTRGDDGATRASYNESTRKLEFSEGDQLFVSGSAVAAGSFAGTLTWQSGGTFSGTIYTQNEWTGTIDDLLNGNNATLLPAGYESYDYLEIIGEGYEALLGENANNSFATSKKLAVEQLSFETGSYTSGTGFVLMPQNAILNFTITGLTASTKVTASLSDGDPLSNIEGEVTTDESGTATFAIGLEGSSDLNEFSLTVGGNPITLVSSSKVLAAGKIYNINRSVAPALAYPIALSVVTADYIGSVVCSDGNVYRAKTAVPSGKTAVGILGKVTATGHGLILALKDATEQTWNTINGWTSVTTYAGTTLKVLPDDAARGANLTSYTTLGETTVSNWAVAQKDDYVAIFENLGSTKNNYGYTYDGNVNAYITTGVGGTAISGDYWSATLYSSKKGWKFYSDQWNNNTKSDNLVVRPVLGF